MANSHNPWADRWESIADQHHHPRDPEMHAEAEDARSRPTRECPEGHTAYYRPGVGGWWCEERHIAR